MNKKFKKLIIGFASSPMEGGPGSFQIRIEESIKKIGWQVVYPSAGVKPDVILLISGTRKLLWLLKNKRKGVPVIQRLDGMSWMHNIKTYGIMLWLKVIVSNIIIKKIRKYISDEVIYQSIFVKNWWKQKAGSINKPESIIYNAVSLNEFKPHIDTNTNGKYILCVEGNLDYSPWVIDLVCQLNEILSSESKFLGIHLYGSFVEQKNKFLISKDIEYKGNVPRSYMPYVYRNCIYLSLDINAACPNTVIEALSSGMPVVGFDTGSLSELVADSAGILVPYGGDPWKLEFPDVRSLADAIKKILKNWDDYSFGARKVAEERFSLEQMTNKYVEVILRSYIRKVKSNEKKNLY